MTADSASDARAACPICGKEAEAGCLYGRDGSWASLQWYAGPPSFVGNLVAGLRGGEPVGEYAVFKGPYARGIRCSRCARIILEC
ncbi:MAG: hypothetical protein IT424_11545 [Pirellulales bacterium]|nr:hypothetical protein [Pirellulales bacterium]